MFGRRRKENRRAESPDPAEEAEQVPARESGPWDADEPHSARERVDLGGLRLPVDPGFEIQLTVEGDRISGAVILSQESALQVQALAAPKRNGIWDEVRAEVAGAVKNAGGTCEERQGPFGAELDARIPGEDGTPQPIRYLGIDGPRWLLRAAISGRAALDAEVAATLENVIRDIVVVRGDGPMAPHEPIELRLPAEARQAMGQQEPGRPDLKPFERGPEIAETR
ncbi:hypothetical protein GCM10010156_08070 [Planobispora rosea]|uniref:DUF3710 domain-containing protein n=1 Tax=Planobispora rosea TaxID=35762 RepID=A0A8J3RXC3_PLARO|nr:DUF3710 domain-containing protein [Planobispora rosea]GGS51806.1 hypothetical protein GCM10010156_08070 [Planobispora rosea]GIH82973.1 hypothetical protein Pro02_13810 [Planobispora rosea]